MEIIDQGAEAVLYREDNDLIKDRARKQYRHAEIDERLRKSRTRREAKILQKLSEIGFPAPRLNSFCDEKMRINMEFLKGKKLRDVLHENPSGFGREIGEKIGILHNHDIIHADLTTSNMILDDEIHFIDFGLSFFSDKTEDKAVDLHLLGRALESKHHEIYTKCWKAAITGYKKTNPQHKLVFSRLEKVKLRGRNKGK